MTEYEKSALEKIQKALDILPPDKQEYIIGFAEGVAAAKGSKDEERPNGA